MSAIVLSLVLSTPSPALPCGTGIESLIVAAFRDGKPIGYKVFSIRRGSGLWVLGLESGDIARSVNGVSLASPEAVLHLPQTLAKADTLEIELERKGRPVTLRTTMPSRSVLSQWDFSLRAADVVHIAPETEIDQALLDLLKWKHALERDSEGRVSPPENDPWDRPYLRHACLGSVGADGRSGTDDDILLGCTSKPTSNPDLCIVFRVQDKWGQRIRAIPRGEDVLAWSFGPDQQPDTSDDIVVLVVGGAACDRST